MMTELSAAQAKSNILVANPAAVDEYIIVTEVSTIPVGVARM